MYATRALSWYLFGKKEFTRAGYENHSKAFVEQDIQNVNLENKVFVVTGGNSGIGKSCVEMLASKGAIVHLLCRDELRGEQARQEIIATTNNQHVHLSLCDLANLDSIRTFCNEMVSASTPIHGLINNAGCMINFREVTREGYDANFATNVLGTFLLTEMLMPCLSLVDGRVVTVSSGGMLTESLELANLHERFTEKYDGTRAYARQKRIQVILTHIWAKKYPKVAFFSMHPGWADTPAVRTSMPGFYEKNKQILRTPQQGADTAVWLAMSPAVVHLPSGGFYFDRKLAEEHMSPVTNNYSPADEEKLYSRIQRMTMLNTGSHVSFYNALLCHEHLSSTVTLDTHCFGVKQYTKCILGSALVNFVQSQGYSTTTRQEAIELCELLADQGKIQHVNGQTHFADSTEPFYIHAPAKSIEKDLLSNEHVSWLLQELNNTDAWTELQVDAKNNANVYTRKMPPDGSPAVKLTTTITDCNMSDIIDLLHTNLTKRHGEWNHTYVNGFVIEEENKDSNYQVWRYNTGNGVHPREFLVAHRCMFLDERSLVIVQRSAHHPSLIPERNADYIRCGLPFNLRLFTPAADGVSIRMDYMNSTSLKGWIPDWLTQKLNPTVSLEEVHLIKQVLAKTKTQTI